MSSKVTALTNITAANLADADELYVVDQDGSGGSPASRAITVAEAKALFGGVTQEELSESPITPDNTVSEYVFDVTNYAEVEITIDGIGFASSDAPVFQISTDNGISYHTGASDYRELSVDPSSDSSIDTSAIGFNDGSGTSDFNGTARISNLRAGRATVIGLTGLSSSARMKGGFANFDGPITHVKFKANSSNNFNAGTIRAVGILSA